MKGELFVESLTQKQKIILAIAGIFVVVLFAIYMNTKSNSNTYTIANENDIEEKDWGNKLKKALDSQ